MKKRWTLIFFRKPHNFILDYGNKVNMCHLFCSSQMKQISEDQVCCERCKQKLSIQVTKFLMDWVWH